MSGRFLTLCILTTALVSAHAPAQTTETGATATVVRDPQALAIANKALQALAPLTALSDITLQGTVSRTAGSDYQSGTFTFQASGNAKSLVALNLDGGAQQEVRNGPVGEWTDAEGKQRPIALHNCWTDASWFYPGLSLQALATDWQVSVLYVGLENRDGMPLHHLRLFRTLPGQTPEMTSQIQRLSTLDLYLDSASYLPRVLAFATHAEEDLNVDIPVEIQFGDYRTVNGVMVPFQMQKLLHETLLLDIRLSSAAANSGLPEALFAVPTE